MTPTCPNCSAKFPGNPCKKCHVLADDAADLKAARMPSATRKRRRHGRNV